MGEEEGFENISTGVNTLDVYVHGDTIAHLLDQAKEEYKKSAIWFWGRLYACWASQNAEQFSRDHKKDFINSIGKFDLLKNSFLNGVAAAANEILMKNGDDYRVDFGSNITSYDPSKYEGDFPDLLTEKYGVKGMNILLVKRAIEEYKLKLNATYSKLDDVTDYADMTELGFHDVDSEIVTKYRETLNSISNTLQNDIEAIFKIIYEKITVETDSLLLGKQNAEQKINA